MRGLHVLRIYAVAGVLAAGCNAIVGVDSVSLVSDAGSDGPGVSSDSSGSASGSSDSSSGGAGDAPSSSGSAGDAPSSSGSAGDAPSSSGSAGDGPGSSDSDGDGSLSGTADSGTAGTADSEPDACPDAPAPCNGGPASCQTSGAGTTMCGSAGESCCTSLGVDGGTYYRTYTNSGSGPTGEADQANVSAFRLDKYLVTVGRFRQFVAAWNNGAGYTPPAGSGKHIHLNSGQGLVNSGGDALSYETGWLTSDNSKIAATDANLICDSVYASWTPTAGTQENLPMACMNWWEAYAFCIWDGGFLPSEAEWEYAAAGGSQQLPYPWGATAPGTANQYAIYGCYYPNGSGSCVSVANTAPVGTATLGAGLWGQLDLAGETWEWTLDTSATYANPCTDCAYLTGGTASRMMRGGSMDVATSSLAPPYRVNHGPSIRGRTIGFRCARAP